jgi:predicted nucleotidyltransferase component of viral defense system
MKTITETNRQLINAIVAEGMNKLPAGVIEKDFLVTEVLQKLAGISIAEMDIVFCGGTCLSKAHSLIERMSEDLDFKVRLFEEVSRSARIRQLSQLKHDLTKHFVDMGFHVPVDGVTARDGNNYFSLALHFQSAFPKVVSLRSEIQVEFSARPMITPTKRLAITSMLEVSASLPSQAFEMTCVSIEETLAEKVLSLLRRTAQMRVRNSSTGFDPRLVRHLFDVHAIMHAHPGIISMMPPALFRQLVVEDAEQFSHQHPEFVINPVAEMGGALGAIKTDPMFRLHYDDFLKDLVYGELVAFETALAAFEDAAIALGAVVS